MGTLSIFRTNAFSIASRLEGRPRPHPSHAPVVARLSGVWLWQHQSWGYLFAGIVLTTMTLVCASIVSDSFFEYAGDPKTSFGVVPAFVAIRLVGFGLLVSHLRTLHPELGAGMRRPGRAEKVDHIQGR